MNTSNESLDSASLSSISKSSSLTRRPSEYPNAQLFPAPPPSVLMKMFSGLNNRPCDEAKIELMTYDVGNLEVPLAPNQSAQIAG